jgi:hypothetical protein
MRFGKMANRKQLKGVKKQRFSSKAGKRCRSKRKKSVAERKRIKRMIAHLEKLERIKNGT